MIDELYAKRTRNSIGKITSPQQDLDFEQLRIYYQEKNKPLNKQFKKNLELATVDNAFNYAAYLLADKNNMSIKVAKYLGKNRVDLSETNEYGYNSLIKACKNVLDKINIENKTTTLITAKERKDQRLWNPIALREAIINAFVHNDFTREAPPKFEIFNDRIEITSTGSLPDCLSEKEFFEGFSIPRNKELIRVFKDLELVEQLGSGIPRIIEFYSKDCFQFSDNFLRIVLPKTVGKQEGSQVTEHVTEQVTEHVTEQVKKLIVVMGNQAYPRTELMQLAGVKHRPTFLYNYLQPAIALGFIELTLPGKPRSSKQQYRLTTKGNKFIEAQLENK